MLKLLIPAIAAISLGCGPTAPVGANQPMPGTVQPGADARGRHGPFATYNRAYERANYFRNLGYSVSQVFHNGDGYYFDVR